jgi:hypothetical protein
LGAGKRQIGLSVTDETADWLRVEAARLGRFQGDLVEAGLVLLREQLGDAQGATAQAARLRVKGMAL